MPREQRTATRKTAVNTTPLGQFKSGIVQSVQYQAVAPEKSSGQKLAEGVGLVAKVATKLTTDYATQENKERTLMESIRQEGLGRQYAGNELSRIREEASQIPTKQRRAFLEKEFNKVNQGLQKNEALDSTYYGTVIRKLSGSLENLATSWDTEILAGQQQENIRLLGGTLTDDFNEGVETQDLIQKANDSGRFTTRGDASKYVVSHISAMIKQNFQDDPTYNWKEAVDNNLLIKSKDGVVDFGKHPVYGKMIDELQSSLRTQAHSNYNNKKAALVAQKEETEAATVKILLDSTKPPGTALENLYANSRGYTVGELNKAKADINKFENTSFNLNNNPDLVFEFNNSIMEGTFNKDLLLRLKNELSLQDYEAILKSKSAFDKSMKIENVQFTMKYFNDQVGTGKNTAGQENPFNTFTKEGSTRRNDYVTGMNTYMAAYRTTGSLEDLTIEQINKWSDDILKRLLPTDDGNTKNSNGGATVINGVPYDANGRVIKRTAEEQNDANVARMF